MSGKAGRKPKPGKPVPAHLRVVNAQDASADEAEAPKAAENINVPGPVAEFEVPDWFDERKTEVFRFLERHLRRLDVIDEVDQLELQAAAVVFAEWGEVQEQIAEYKAKHGGQLIYKTSGRNGTQYKTHPLFHQAADLERRTMAFGSNFGLSPVDRERIKYLRKGPSGGAQGDLLD